MNSFRFIERGIRAEIARQERAAARRRAGRAGDAALRPAHRADHVAALQGGGARLPLLPRARPRRRSRSRRRCSSARAPRCPSCPPRARSASSASSASAPTPRGCWPGAPSCGDYFEAALRRGRRASSRSRWPTGSTSSSRASTASDPAAVEGRARRRWRRSSAWSAPRRSPQGARQAGARPLVADGGDPERDRRGRGPGRDRRRRRARRRSSQAALDANPDVAEKLHGGDMKPIGVDHRPRHAARPRAAPTAARSPGSCARSSACRASLRRRGVAMRTHVASHPDGPHRPHDAGGVDAPTTPRRSRPRCRRSARSSTGATSAMVIDRARATPSRSRSSRSTRTS